MKVSRHSGNEINRRTFLASAAPSAVVLGGMSAALAGAGIGKTPIIDTHMHVWSGDPNRFPFAHPYEPDFKPPRIAATVELLKVLLRMTSERHAVASKVIATVDDLDQIAADDQADVAALHGWRRELFGEAALALKHGRLALAIEKGRVVRVDRA